MANYDLNKLLCNFIEITLRCECSPVNLLQIFRTPFYKNTSKGLIVDTLTYASFIVFVHL